MLPQAAGCAVESAEVELVTEDGDHDHEHDHDHDDGHDHDDEDHHDEDDEEHAGHDDEHGDGPRHSEFHAVYRLACADPAEIDGISFAYFDAFPNAQELEVQVVSDKGARSFEVERDTPELDLGGAI